MDKTITLLLQLSLITPFVMLLVTALVGLRILKGHPHWPALCGVALTAIVGLISACFFRDTIVQHTYTKTLVSWLALGHSETQRLTIGVLFDPLSLAFLLLISLTSMLYLLFDPPLETENHSPARPRLASLVYLFCFSATTGIVLATNFLQLLLFWLMLSMSLNLLHETTFINGPDGETAARHWWGWNAFSDGMLLLAVLLIGVNFRSLDFLSCLQPDAIQTAFTQNRVALPGIGAALFLAAVPRLNLFPASALVVSRETTWPAGSLAALNLLSLPAGLFLLLRTAPYFLAIEASQRLLLQLGTLSALLTLFSAFCLTRGQQPDRGLHWLAATLGGIAVAVLGLSDGRSLSLIAPVVLLQAMLFAQLIPLQHRFQKGTLPKAALSSLKVCVLLSMLAAFASLGALLPALVAARKSAEDGRTEWITWLLLALVAGYVSGLVRWICFLKPRAGAADAPTTFPLLPLWVMTVLVCTLCVTVYVPIPFVPQLGPALMGETSFNPFDQDWLYSSLFCVLPLVTVILAWMTTTRTDKRSSRPTTEPVLIQLGQSHFYALSLLNRTLIQPCSLLAKLVVLLDEWIVARCSRFSLEQLPARWGLLLKQMQNGQIAFQTLVLLFTLSILVFVLLVLRI